MKKQLEDKMEAMVNKLTQTADAFSPANYPQFQLPPMPTIDVEKYNEQFKLVMEVMTVLQGMSVQDAQEVLELAKRFASQGVIVYMGGK